MPVFTAIVVEWLGPYSTLEAARGVARQHDLGEAIYMAIGKRAYQRHSSLQYVGISSRISDRLHNGRFTEITSEFGIWVGIVVSHAVAGRRRVRHSHAVDLAEWGTAFFLKIALNVRKRRTPPPSAFVLINRWYHPNDTIRKRRPYRAWPDYIEYDGRGDSAKIAWFGAPGRILRLSPAEVEDYRLI